MIKYFRFIPQTPYACVPVCLQAILSRREKPVPLQKEILKSFNVKEDGIDLNEKALNKFLKKYDLKTEHIKPRASLIEPDLIIKEALEKGMDNLVAFYYDLLYKRERQARHVSLVVDFKDPQGVFLHDPEKGLKKVNLDKLVESMTDERCGFYLIDDISNDE